MAEHKEQVEGELKKVYAVKENISKNAHIKSMEEYKKLYDESIKSPDQFWSKMAKENLDWFRPFTSVRAGNLTEGNVAWFLNGQLNACYNCVDRHLATRGDKVAILWEGDEVKDVRSITYNQLFVEVCKFANVLKSVGVKKGDTVCIYMPMVPEAAIAMLACARLGAPHSVVFAGFSAEALGERIEDGKCKVVITADEGMRGGRGIPLKTTVDRALNTHGAGVSNVLVYRNTGKEIPMKEGRDLWLHEQLPKVRGYCPCETVDSEDMLFMLFTSGSTGKPKGIQHCTAGYLLYTSLTHRYVFDVHEDDVYACVADVGWITGHSYVVYGPLMNGATTFMFEGTPMYPDAGRYWDMVQRHKITQFYTAPTAIRALMKFGTQVVTKYDRSSLRVLGTVGEPINPEAWRWYYEVVGDSKCAIVDTYWQTETGGHMITPLPGATPMKPGSGTLPFFGVDLAILDEKTGQIKKESPASGVLAVAQPWPSMARTIFGDHARFKTTYLQPYPGYYFTGDGCKRDEDGFYWITGRVDDVINVSGHRIGTAEIESALVAHPAVAEAAVIGVPHDIKGQALFAYVTLKNGFTSSKTLHDELINRVKDDVGSFAKPDEVLITAAVPKTRSGKIMRRVLRKIACNETDSMGDISTLADPGVVTTLIQEVAALRRK